MADMCPRCQTCPKRDETPIGCEGKTMLECPHIPNVPPLPPISVLTGEVTPQEVSPDCWRVRTKHGIKKKKKIGK